MRIALAIHSLDPSLGGVTSATLELSLSLAARGHEVSLITFDAPAETFLKEISIPFLALGPTQNSYGFIKNLNQKLSPYKNSFDTVVFNGLWLYSTAGIARWARREKIPYVVFPHGMLDPYFAFAYPVKHLKKLIYWLCIERHALQNAAAICYTTTSEKSLSQKTFPFFSPRRQEVIGLGLKSFEGNISSSKESFFLAYPQLRDKPFLLYLSRFHPKKAPDILLRALKNFPAVTLVMAGPQENSPYYESLQKLSSPQVFWTGLLTGEKKWGALAAAEALVLPSHQENFGMVVAEALSMGTPALISDKVALAPDVLADHCGLVMPDTLAGVESLLEKFSTLSNSEKQTLRANASASYITRYTLPAVAKRLEKLLGEVS